MQLKLFLAEATDMNMLYRFSEHCIAEVRVRARTHAHTHTHTHTHTEPKVVPTSTCACLIAVNSKAKNRSTIKTKQNTYPLSNLHKNRQTQPSAKAHKGPPKPNAAKLLSAIVIEPSPSNPPELSMSGQDA